MQFNVTESIQFNLGTDFIFEDTGSCASSLKHIPPGEVWSQREIQIRKESLFCRGRDWLVVDNLIIHENIKLGAIGSDKHIRNFQQTLINLSICGIKVVCYNFMPVFYKVRTHFNSPYPNKHVFSLFDTVAFTAFDLYILKRADAESYSSYQKHLARCYDHNLKEKEKSLLTKNILSAAQSDKMLTIGELKEKIRKYAFISSEDLTQNLLAFEAEVLPLAESLGIKMHFNSDNPCSNLLGLPSVREL